LPTARYCKTENEKLTKKGVSDEKTSGTSKSSGKVGSLFAHEAGAGGGMAGHSTNHRQNDVSWKTSICETSM